MTKVRRVLTARVFTEVDERSEDRSLKWLAAQLVGSPKFNREPTVVVVTDESGKELARSSFGDVNDGLRAEVEKEFPTQNTTK